MPEQLKPSVLIICGVAGSGKTTVGQLLADKLGWKFADADWFHSSANIEKMTSGIGLTDADRAPWLKSMHDAIELWIVEGEPTVLACSALKASYRNELTVDAQRVRFVFLKAPREVLAARLKERPNHYMKSSMLDSQFEALEEPTNAIIVDASKSTAEIVDELERRLPAGF